MKRQIEDHLTALDVAPVGGTPTPLGGEELAGIEAAVGDRLPDHYRDFAQTYGAVSFGHLIQFRLDNAVPLFAAGKSLRYEAAPLSHFYGAGTGPQGLAKKIRLYKGRMPDTLIPVADDGGGNQICLGVAGADRGKVYYWDHNNEWDEDDYEEDYGTPMPPEAKFQNVYLVVDSFDAFLLRLEKVSGG